ELALYYPPGLPPGAGFTFGFGTVPVTAQDSGSTSPYADHAYMAWSDNGNLTTNPGYATIEVAVSTNGGTSFSPPSAILPTSTSTVYAEPSISVQPNGNVWVTFLGIDISTGNYNIYGVLSQNGGTSWSNLFLLSDATSTPGTAISDIGLFTSALGTSNGIYPMWLDCSSSSCATSADAQLATANVHAVLVAANITGVSATISTFGAARAYALPATLGWDNASQSTVTVPQFLPDSSNSSDVYTFEAWSGLSTSTNFQTTVSFSGGSGAPTLMANYKAVPAAILTGTVTPNVPGLSVKVNGVPAPLTPFNATAQQYMAVVPGGISYLVQASAPNYAPQSHNIQTNQGGTYYWNFTLLKLPGYIVGQLTPSTATLTINGTTVTTVNSVTGLFNVAEPFGWYWINASGSGLTSFSAYRQVLAGGNTTVNIVLTGGWVQGVVLGAQPTKPGLVVKLDGAPIAVSSAGTFNNSTLGGYHTITATQSGYNLSTISLFVAPGHTTLVNVTLTNHGWISGLIGPSTSISAVTLHIYSGSIGNFYPVAANGTFNVSLVGGLNYTVNVSATNYISYQTHVLVTPGNGSQLQVTLQPKPTGCTGPNCNTGNPPPTTSNSGLTTTDLLLIVVVIVVVAAVAVVLLMRRRGGGGAPPEEEAQPVYEESNPANLPRLQSDGTMGPGNSPPPSG
ncbi:MAG TPA: hypothetical protein VEY07_01040, partial [Thermoplasmata archaeon]|nr:hypothetical protein [Thermoplasmata archaeon]